MEKIENNPELKLQKYKKAAEDAYQNILAEYTKMIDEISDDHFILLKDTVEKEIEKDFCIMKAGSMFRAHLNEQTKKAFSKMWKDCDMESSIILLEQAKSEYVCENAWRPTNKSVEDQIEPHLRRMLEQKRRTLESQVQFQKQQIAEIVPLVENARQTLRNRMERRAQYIARMERDEAKLLESGKDIQKIISNSYSKCLD